MWISQHIYYYCSGKSVTSSCYIIICTIKPFKVTMERTRTLLACCQSILLVRIENLFVEIY